MYYSSSIRSLDPYLYSKRDRESKSLFVSVTTLQSIDEEVRKTEEVVNNSSLPLTIISIMEMESVCGLNINIQSLSIKIKL